MNIKRDINTAAQWLKQADGLLIGAGAGMGVDSGLPDFRGNQGFWKAYPPLGRAGIEFVEIANPASFIASPELAWGFYGHRLQLYRDTQPHHGFQILQTLAEKMEHKAFVFTSNVDGQFQKAGFDPGRVAECHGSIHSMQCSHSCSRNIWPARDLIVDVDEEHCHFRPELPTCMECGALARPNILMFNDWGWISDITDQQMGKLNAWYKKVTRPVVIELGAGTSIPSVRRVCESTQAPLIRINPTESHVSGKHSIGLQLHALEALQMIQNAYHAL